MKFLRFLAVLFMAAGMLLIAGRAQAQGERILDFSSLIKIAADGELTVTETITVMSQGREIRRGIFRDFPTTYTTASGATVRVGFDVEKVFRDGRPEPFHTESRSNGVRVYIGDKDVLIPNGRHTYEITYVTDRQIGFFPDHDELYFNVTGNDWAFAMDKVRATVILPPGANSLEAVAYTGPTGSRASDATISGVGGSRVSFSSTKPLAPREGMTIAVSWPKGFVPEPSAADKARMLAGDNMPLIMAALGFVLVLFYYLYAWFKAGRDPAKGTIIPLFSPPAKVSPAGVRYVSRMGFDDKAFATAVVDMAAKGFLSINQNGKIFTLTRLAEADALSNDTGLSKGERKLGGKLFYLTDSIELKQKNHKRISNARSALKKSLKAEYEKAYFLTNSMLMLPGIVLTLATAALVVVSSPNLAEAAGIGLWLTIWTVGTTLMTAASIAGLRRSFLRSLGRLLFSLPFIAGEFVGGYLFARTVGVPTTLLLIATLMVSGIFYHLLKAPTLAGRALLDQIEGFKLFLGVAEKDRLNMLNPPEVTPALFEKYLPYAMALDVENEWGEKFEAHLARAGQDPVAYQPGWYMGNAWYRGGPSGFSKSMGAAFAGAIASSASAPGSSSGFSGGGSSGGGGGGGGGGGW